MKVEAIGMVYSSILEGIRERIMGLIGKEVSQRETMREGLSRRRSISDTFEPNPLLSVYLSPYYQQQQAYVDAANRIIKNQGLPLSFGAPNLKPIQTLIKLTDIGWMAVLPYKPYIYHNLKWYIPREYISIIW